MNRLGWTIAALFALALIVLAGIVHVHPATAPVAIAVPSRGGDLVIPVAGVRAADLRDSWGEARGDGTRQHHAIDIMAPRGTAVLAATAGRIEKLFESVAGGHTIYVRTADGGTVDYYAHLDSYAPGVAEGMAVQQGQHIASVGSTGDADPSAPHLHFEIKRMARGESWWQGTDVDPYPLLVATATPR